jgi:ABC-type polysaccharide/polyol phosphate export permease
MSSTSNVQHVESDRDEATHEASYRQFSLLVYMAVLHVANFLVALAIGAIQGNWIEAFVIMLLAIILGASGVMKAKRLPIAMLLLASLILLGFND